jgi:hypothetical protein
MTMTLTELALHCENTSRLVEQRAMQAADQPTVPVMRRENKSSGLVRLKRMVSERAKQ